MVERPIWLILPRSSCMHNVPRHNLLAIEIIAFAPVGVPSPCTSGLHPRPNAVYPHQLQVNPNQSRFRSRPTYLSPPSRGRPSVRQVILDEQLKPVPQRPRIGVLIPLELECVGYDFDWPVAQRSVLTCFKAQKEVAGILGVNAECVHGALGVGFSICREPLL